MNLQKGLASPDPAVRRRSYFATCLSASQVADWDLEAIARAYSKISERLIAAEAAGEASGPRNSEPDELLAWALVFGYRSFEVAAQLLPLRMTGRWTEVGAGIGPVALLAAARGAEAVAVEPSLRHGEFGRRLMEAAGLSVDYRRRWSEASGNLVFPYSLREIFRSSPAPEVAEDLRRWSQKSSVWVIEPGTRSTAQWLAPIRNLLDDRVVAPCPSTGDCPRTTGRDWCHFTWSLEYPDDVKTVFDRSRRRHQEAHFCYLHLGEPKRDLDYHRVLASRSAGKAKWQLDLCSQGGATERLVALRRQKDGFADLQIVRANDLVSWRPEQVEIKGDGTRLIEGTVARVPRETD